MFEFIKDRFVKLYEYLQKRSGQHKPFTLDWFVMSFLFGSYQLFILLITILIGLFIAILSTYTYFNNQLTPSGSPSHVFEMIGSIASVGSFIAIILAYLEYRQSATAQRFNMRPLLIPGVVANTVFSDPTIGGKHLIRLYKVDKSPQWSVWVDNIETKDHKPIFVVKNHGKGPASHLQISIAKGTSIGGDLYKFDFSNSSNTIQIKTIHDLPSGKEAHFWSENEAIDKKTFYGNFCLKIVSYSEFTNETMVNYYIAMTKSYKIQTKDNFPRLEKYAESLSDIKNGNIKDISNLKRKNQPTKIRVIVGFNKETEKSQVKHGFQKSLFGDIKDNEICDD